MNNTYIKKHYEKGDAFNQVETICQRVNLDKIQIKLGINVRHDEVYNGNEVLKIVGIRESEIELEGDYSGGIHNLIQKDWLPIKGAFVIYGICKSKDEKGNCPLHNIHCQFPNCEKMIDN